MSKQIAAVTYTFVFNPGETWQHLYQFENSLNNYLKSDGLQAEIIQPMGAGIAGKMVHIYPIEEPEPPKLKQSKMAAGEQIRKLGKK